MLIFPLNCTCVIVFLHVFLPRCPPDLTRSPNSLLCGQMSQLAGECAAHGNLLSLRASALDLNPAQSLGSKFLFGTEKALHEPGLSDVQEGMSQNRPSPGTSRDSYCSYLHTKVLAFQLGLQELGRGADHPAVPPANNAKTKSLQK